MFTEEGMQRKKSREEIAGQAYLTIADIQKLLMVSWSTAKRIYTIADSFDKELGDMRIEPHKVRFTSAMKASGTNVNVLLKQIKGTQQG